MARELVISLANNSLLPVRVDELALSEPNATFAEISVSASTYAHGFKSISYAQLSNAVNGVAWWLEKSLGKGKDFETLTYIGPNDLCYPIIILAAVKVGYKILLVSPRNSIAAQVNLFTLLGCKKLISTDLKFPHVTSILPHFEMQLFKMPALEELLGTKQPQYPFNRTFEEGKNEPLVVIHTSGSTGLPKPLVVPHLFATRYANIAQAIPQDGLKSQSQLFHSKRLVITMPLFHAAGVDLGLISPLLNRTVTIHLRSGAPPSGEGLIEVLQHTKADAAFVSPNIVEEISKDPTLLDAVSRCLKAIVYAGGDLPQTLGDAVATRTKLFSLYGTSEMGQGVQVETLDRDPTDWKYLHFDEELLGMKFKHHSEDLHELVIVKSPTFIHYQTPFAIAPELDEFSTRDLFSPHPTKPSLWTHRGRSDDILVFLNGEKTNPLSMEGHIAGHPAVRSVLVVGNQRFQAALLIELLELQDVTTTKGRAQAIDGLWPIISETNRDCPAHARIDKDHILFVTPEKPMLRAGKGTVMRFATVKLYEEEIDELFKNADSLSHPITGNRDVVAVNDIGSLESHIRKVVKDLNHSWSEFSSSDDFFGLGMDSLQAIQLTRALRMDLGTSDVSFSTIYSHPSISALAQAIFSGLEKDEANNYQEMIATTLQKYTESIDAIAEKAKETLPRMIRPNATGHNVLLTGSTGALGSYLLHTLLASPEVAHTYCLNRSPDSLLVQKARNEAKSLPVDFPPDRVTFLTSDLSSPHLGLEEKQYSSLQSNTTLVIHSAWKVDFNLTLPSFSAQLAGVVNLLAFSATAMHNSPLLYVSSISSIQNLTDMVPEKIITDPSAPSKTGYGQSKHIAECLLSHAAEVLGLRTGVARVGQIAGPARLGSVWNAHEWLPSLVISSKYLGSIPSSLGLSDDDETEKIDWVPIDELAEVLVGLSLSLTNPGESTFGETKVFHPLNPSKITWKQLLPDIVDIINSHNSQDLKLDISIVSFSEWLKILNTSQSTTTTKNTSKFLTLNPAIKLLPFYQEMGVKAIGTRMSTKMTEGMSEKLRTLEGIRAEWMRRWLREWLALETQN